MVGHLNGGYTVEEVAERTGTTIRTVRWYQSEGLLPSPRRSGRVALYTDEHVARLDAIRDLQAHGLTLDGHPPAARPRPGHAATTALAFAKAAVARTGEIDAEIVTAAEGAARLHVDPAETPDGVDEALLEELGMVRVLPDGRWQIRLAVFQRRAELAAGSPPRPEDRGHPPAARAHPGHGGGWSRCSSRSCGGARSGRQREPRGVGGAHHAPGPVAAAGHRLGRRVLRRCAQRRGRACGRGELQAGAGD